MHYYNAVKLNHQRPNQAFKRTHTGGASLLIHRASRAPARAA